MFKKIEIWILYLVILLPHSFGDNDSRYFDNPRTLNIMIL